MSEPTRPLRHLARLVAHLQAATANRPRPDGEERGPSIWAPIHLGVDEYGHQVSNTLAYRNLLIAGEPGAGKSVGLNNVVAHAATALVARSSEEFPGWGRVVIFAASAAARIGEVAGVRVGDIDTASWTWTVRRQTTPSPGGLVDNCTKGERARKVPLIVEVRELVTARLAAIGGDPDARLFTGPRGGRITTAILQDATHWEEVVTALGFEHLRRHDLRHTGLTWIATPGSRSITSARSPDTAPLRPPSGTCTRTTTPSSAQANC
jgi:hypothetical protein